MSTFPSSHFERVEQFSVSQSVSANKEHFNSPAISQKYDEQPLHAEMAKRIGNALLRAYSFDEESTMILDFACGTGLNSRILAPYVKSILGVDISQEMVDRYNERVRNQGIPEDEMHAICIPEELVTRNGAGQVPIELDELFNGVKFDVVICCMSYHHFASISYVTRMLASFLKPGGYLFVADVESVPRPSNHSESSTELETLEPIFSDGVCEAGIVVHKYGFSEKSIRNVFEEADLLGSFRYEIVTRAFKKGKAVKIFLASGVKPLSVHSILNEG